MSRFDARAVARMERMYGSPPIMEQRACTRAALGIKPGERGADIGCGIGLLTCELAKEVGASGRVVGLDVSADMIDAARERAKGLANAEFRVCDATSLDIPAASLDFAAAVQVYLYVKDVERALASVARALKPGGRLVIVDTDWDSCVWLSGDRERHERIIEARVKEFGQPHLPPLLPRLLRGAGFDLAKVEAFPVLNTRFEAESLSGGMVETMAAIVTKFGIDRADAQAWVDDMKARTGDGDYFFSLNRYLFLARKP